MEEKGKMSGKWRINANGQKIKGKILHTEYR
jgi:hypothetical protein